MLWPARTFRFQAIHDHSLHQAGRPPATSPQQVVGVRNARGPRLTPAGPVPHYRSAAEVASPAGLASRPGLDGWAGASGGRARDDSGITTYAPDQPAQRRSAARGQGRAVHPSTVGPIRAKCHHPADATRTTATAVAVAPDKGTARPRWTTRPRSR